MPARFVRIIALSLIVLGVLPFTSPFPTCDWGTFTAQRQTDRTPGDQATPGTLIKAATDPDDAPVVAATTALTTPLFNIVPNETAVRVAPASSQRILLQGLRI
jgi:hypothetical protein